MLRALTKTGLISAAARESSRASAGHDDEGRARHAAMQLQRWVKKIGGTQTAALAPASWGQATFAFFGAAFTALVVVAVNAEVTRNSTPHGSHRPIARGRASRRRVRVALAAGAVSCRRRQSESLVRVLFL